MSQPSLQIAFTTPLPPEGFTDLAGYTLNAPQSEAQVLVSTFDCAVNRRMMDCMPHLRLIANFGVGYNNIDLSACRERHILVTNTPQPVIEPTAELAFGLMLTLARRIAEFDRKLRTAEAEPFGVMNNLSHSLYGATLGIIGMGRIGQALARRAQASGMKIVYHNRRPLDTAIESLYNARYLAFDDLLRQSDFVSLNLPYTPDVRHLMGAEQFQRMKPTACLINTARGQHVDEQALVRALKSGQIAGAAMDVYEDEPNISPDLLRLDQVVLSPHTGTGTWEGRLDMCRNVCANILHFARGEYNQMDLVNPELINLSTII